MTSQTKRFIETSDILGMRFECSCGTSVIIPIASYQSMPTVCATCDVQFSDYSDRSVQEAFAGVVSALRRAQNTADRRKFKFALEITPSTVQNSESER
jgi:hypothetical protein